eukprot:TRINITY_DN76212_c0_g1_i1.p1 TRINITY_DN76212_c0_g1~~TRINITY_DN76212_c0_g1_i1.p1  ORF type:complete len:558 (+),score=76.90 TRINITY_DN76212_c0_g1_i1:166-1839(+)
MASPQTLLSTDNNAPNADSSATSGTDGQSQRVGTSQLTWCEKMFLKELKSDQRRAYFWFATGLFMLLGSQSMIQPPTTSTFINSVAYSKIPLAQTWLPVVYLPILFFYNFLITTFKKTPMVVIVIMCLLYSGIYWAVAVNTLLVYDWKGGKEGVLEPRLAWIFYYASNTKSVLFPVMFWSVMADVSDRQTDDGTPFSKIAYGTLVFGGQAGGIIGSMLAGNNNYLGGTPMLVISQAAVLLIAPVLMWRGFSLMKKDRSPAVQGPEVESRTMSRREAAASGCKKVGGQMYLLVEGLVLILKHPVLLGIFWIAAAHLIPRVILDFQGTGVVQWKWPAKHGDKSPEAQHNKQLQTAFFAWCNLANNLGTMALSFLGLRSIVEKGGLALGLIACPLISLAAILSVCACGSEQSDTRFWTVQIVLVFVNVVQYALNGPCREMLYVHSTKDIKYKAKSWSDMYGNIMQKTIAAQINLNINDKEFQPVWSGIFCSVWVGIWIVIAVSLGFYHTTLEKDHKTIGKDDTGKWYCLRNQASGNDGTSLQGGAAAAGTAEPNADRSAA